MRHKCKYHEIVMRKLQERHEKDMRQLWDSHETMYYSTPIAYFADRFSLVCFKLINNNPQGWPQDHGLPFRHRPWQKISLETLLLGILIANCISNSDYKWYWWFFVLFKQNNKSIASSKVKKNQFNWVTTLSRLSNNCELKKTLARKRIGVRARANIYKHFEVFTFTIS